jgi:hypothetical protein
MAAAGEDLSALTVPKLRALCKQQSLPSTGNKPQLLERLGNPEQLRGLSNEDSAAVKVSPVKVDSRAEECPCCGGVAALDHQCGEPQLPGVASAGSPEPGKLLAVSCPSCGGAKCHHPTLQCSKCHTRFKLYPGSSLHYCSAARSPT